MLTDPSGEEPDRSLALNMLQSRCAAVSVRSGRTESPFQVRATHFMWCSNKLSFPKDLETKRSVLRAAGGASLKKRELSCVRLFSDVES